MQRFKRRLLPLLLTLLASQSAQAHPDVFSDNSFDAAKTQAKSAHKWLVADFTATWCGPCHRMDQVTWTDAAVKKWVADNAVAVQVDVDKDKELAQSFHIAAMPSVLIFKADDQSKEFDRHVGFADPKELLKWFDNIEKGRTELSLAQEKLSAVKGKGGEAEVDARYKLADKLADAGDYGGAAEQLAWLWKNIPTEAPAMSGVRGSFMVAQMEQVVRHDAGARAEFEKLRAEALASAKQKGDWDDWIVLNSILDHENETLDWFDKSKNDPKMFTALEKEDFRLRDVLFKSKRLADLTVLYPKPLESLKKKYDFAQEVTKTMKSMPGATGGGQEFSPFPSDAAIIYAAYLAAGNTKVAEEISSEALKLSDTPILRRQLVGAALVAFETLIDQSKLTEALAVTDSAIKLDPKSAPPYCCRGEVRFKQGDLKGALADFNQSIKLDPSAGRGRAYFDRAEANEKLGDKKAAEADRAEAKKLGYHETAQK